MTIIHKRCKNCGIFYKGFGKFFCSCKCSARYNHKIGKIGVGENFIPWNKGKKLSTEHRKKLSKSHKGQFLGNKHPNWKGGKMKHNMGYILVYHPNHPKVHYNYVFEHILVMEKHLGRFLKPEEGVHHINHKKDDNRIKNLMLIPRSKHSSLHCNAKKGYKGFQKIK